jgi:hypothetical protein
MRNESVQLVKEVATATGTVSAGVLTYLQIIPPVLGCIAALLGIILTSLMIIKVKEERHFRRDAENRKVLIDKAVIDDIEYRQKNNLPVKEYV